ncbi:MAG: hypothetical protein O3B24_04780, partial [Verrucomicrobia bacterium]|nr:hypothetical protein [Verrucomicrobiota bacterium]
MKRLISILGLVLFAVLGRAEAPRVAVSALAVRGEIEGENIVFSLTFDADVARRGETIPLVTGDVAFLDGQFPRKATLLRQGDSFALQFNGTGRQSVTFRFASRAGKEREWRRTGFAIPAADVRQVAVVCDRDDLEVRFPGALKTQRGQNAAGRTEVTAFLGLTGQFEVLWKPEVKRMDAELVVAAEANTIATASVGAMRLDSIYTYRIVQGAQSKIALKLPDAVNITQVRGEDIQDWSVRDQMLTVTLSRPREGVYKLHVESETALPEFPSMKDLPVMTPQGVIRTSGFLMIGSDSAVKLLVKKSLGLTQVDQAAFPQVTMDVPETGVRTLPSRSTFAYQYVNMPYTLQLDADDIVPEYSADDRLVLSLKDNDLVFLASTEIDVRDSGTRELVFATDPTWIVANVTGSGVSDYDVREVNSQRLVHVYFAQAVLGRALVEIRLEKSLGEGEEVFAAPRFHLTDARSERGHLVLATEKGLRLRAMAQTGIREVRTGSTPMTVEGAQQAFRFKQAGWSLDVAVQRTTSTLNAEIFHLVSIGEGVLYGASTVTYHIDGAPVREFAVRIPADFQNVEFTGRDVRGWEQKDGVWTVSLLEKVIGDYTLLATYNQPYTYEGAAIEVGGMSTENTASELGYIALAGAASLKFPEETFDSAAVIPIDADEIPAEYKLLINDPVLKAYKHVRTPHIAKLKLVRYETESLLNQIVDHATVQTAISRDGEAVTTIDYYIKNTSQQYLVVALPPGATLWSSTLMGTDGVRAPVAALENDGSLLVPLQRPRDPNAAMKLEIVYAESFKKPGVLGANYTLMAPDLPQTHAIATTWSISPPTDMAVSVTGGNMLTTQTPGPRGLRAVFSRLGAMGTRLLIQGRAALPALALLLGLCALVAYTVGRRRGLAASMVLAVLCIPVVGWLLLLAAGRVGFGLITCQTPPADAGTVVFTKTVALAGGEVLRVTLGLVPDWIGAAGSKWTLILAGAAGLVILVVAAARRMRLGAAFGLTLLAVAMAQTSYGRIALVALIGLPFAILVMRFAWRLVRWCHRHGVARRSVPPPLRHSESPGDVPKRDLTPLEDGPFAPAERGQTTGSAPPLLLLALAAFCTVAAAALATGAEQPATQQVLPVPQTEAPPPPQPALATDPTPVAASLEYVITGPGTGRDAERSAAVREVRTFATEGGVTFRLLAKPAVLTDYELGSARLKLRTEADGYYLVVDRKGNYTVTLQYLLPVGEQGGTWDLRLDPPDNMRNSVKLTLPESGLDVRCAEAVLFKAESQDAGTTATAVLGTTHEAHLVWLPRVRKTTLEKVLFFCEVNSFASFEPGVVDVINVLRFQIAQGELKAFTVTIPAGMSVTAVKAPGLSTWRFDPEQHLLEAALDLPVTGDFAMEVITQIAMDGLPYEATLGALSVQGAERQRGSIALAAPDTVQLQVGALEGLNAMNVADFSTEAATAALQQSPGRALAAVKRAFRYQAAPFSVAISAARVLPEIRVVEKGSLSIADERIVLSTQLGVAVAKAGVFSLRLRVPKDFDVETLTGEDISHWDEVDDPEGNVIVHFNKQLMGTRTLNIVVASMEKNVADGRLPAAGGEGSQTI